MSRYRTAECRMNPTCELCAGAGDEKKYVVHTATQKKCELVRSTRLDTTPMERRALPSLSPL